MHTILCDLGNKINNYNTPLHVLASIFINIINIHPYVQLGFLNIYLTILLISRLCKASLMLFPCYNSYYNARHECRSHRLLVGRVPWISRRQTRCVQQMFSSVFRSTLRVFVYKVWVWDSKYFWFCICFFFCVFILLGFSRYFKVFML